MRPKKTSTLHDVAAYAGVSTATVSRCLNFPDQVAEATRSKVLNSVKELDYSPNFGAKAMAARRTNTIGAIIPTMENAIFARGLQAFQEELRRHGFTMLVASTSYDPQIEDEQIRSLVARGADGLLLIGHARDPAIYDFLEIQNVPALVAWAFDPKEPRPSVGFDNKLAMRQMAEKVISMGHHELAMISAETGQNDRAQERCRGVKDAMAAAGLNPDDLYIVETPYGIDAGATAFESIHARSPKSTVVLCGNDVLAVGALRRAQELGLSVPRDMSIVGFDDIELAQVAYPSLTTVHVPHQDMGRMAALALVDHVQNGIALTTAKLPTSLVLRHSLTAPNSSSEA